MKNKILSLILLLFVCFLLSTLPACSLKTAGTDRVNPPEQAILKKISREPVSKRFEPVLIYIMVEPSVPFFVGSGLLFLEEDERQILTSEHLLTKENGRQIYAYRPLRSPDQPALSGIERVLKTGKEITGDTADVVILKPGAMTPIESFSLHSVGFQMETFRGIKPYPEGRTLRSLVSGEKVRLLGEVSCFNQRTPCALLEYTAQIGESGTGFVDEDNNVYVLKAKDSQLPMGALAKILKTFGEVNSELALAVGPIKLNK